MSIGGGGDEIPETEEERELARIGLSKIQRFQEITVPLENQFMRRELNLGRDTRDAVGAASAGTQQAFDASRGASLHARETASNVAGGFTDQAVAGALSSAEARDVARDRNIEVQQGLLQVGMGQGNEALSGLADAADVASRQAIDRGLSRADERAGRAGAIGIGAGYLGQRGLSAMGSDDKGSF